MSVRTRRESGERGARPFRHADEIYRWIDQYVELDGPRTSFLSGVASLWDFSGLLTPRVRVRPNFTMTTSEQALQEAWEAVGRDLASVMPPMDGIDPSLESNQDQT